MRSAVRHSVPLGIAVLALSIGGCGIHEQTQGWHPRFDGVTAEAGDIGLRNVVLVASTDGQVSVLASFSNRGPSDELVEVRLGDSSATPRGGAMEIPADGYASLSPDTTQVNLQDVDVTPGHMAELEFHFEHAPRVTVETLVKEAAGRYASSL